MAGSSFSVFGNKMQIVVVGTWQVHLVSNTPGVLPGALDIMPRLPGMVVNTA
jgi:hypothetical protein